MVRRSMESSSIVWADYDAGARTLDLEYAGGGVYRYFGVPPAVYAQLLAAESKGAFVNTVIKKRYRYVRL